MRKRFIALFIGVMVAAPALVPAPAPASGDWTANVRYKKQRSLCENDGQYINIGGGVLQGEKFKSSVEAFKIEWQLFTVDPRSAGARPRLRHTIYHSKFGDTRSSIYWDIYTRESTWFQWNDLNANNEYWLVAKMIWVRNNRRDWKYSLPVAYCS